MPSGPKWVNDTLEGLMGSLMRTVHVIEIQSLNQFIKKIQFKGDLTKFNFLLGYAILIRVSDTQFRNYTASFADAERGILEIVFYLHRAAPGTNFINQLKIGDEVRVSIPRGQKQYDPMVKKQFVFGDETSLGLACSFLPFFKKNKNQYHYYFELDQTNYEIPFLLGLENYSIYPKDTSFTDDQWVSKLPIFNTEAWQKTNFIITGNVRSVQTFRKVLKRKSVKGKIMAKGFWLEGKTGL